MSETEQATTVRLDAVVAATALAHHASHVLGYDNGWPTRPLIPPDALRPLARAVMASLESQGYVLHGEVPR